MVLRRNIAANYAGQIYVTLVGLIVVPLYLGALGAESYGLVGFFAMLQVWFNLLDTGLSHSLSRETARFKGGALERAEFAELFRAVELIFILLGAAGVLLLIASADLIATSWLNTKLLSTESLRHSIMLMVIGVGMRWGSVLYRSVISGSEQLVWLAAFSSVIASFRFLGVLPIIYWVSATPEAFFGYQAVVAAVELAVLFQAARRVVPHDRGLAVKRWSLAPLRRILPFAMSMTVTATVWILVTQTDKLLLSKLLSLSDYGYFSLGTLVASSILMFVSPIGGAIVPRMTRLHAENDVSALLEAYSKATQLGAVVAGTAGFCLAAMAEPILRTWTGDSIASRQTANVLALYSVGYVFLSMTAFSSHLQVAYGNLRLHVIGSLLFVCCLVPGVVIATLRMGAEGAGWVWLACNAVYFFAWVPIVHHGLIPGRHWRWLGRDVLPPMLASAGLSFAAGQWVGTQGRMQTILELALAGSAILFVSALTVPAVRTRILSIKLKG